MHFAFTQVWKIIFKRSVKYAACHITTQAASNKKNGILHQKSIIRASSWNGILIEKKHLSFTSLFIFTFTSNGEKSFGILDNAPSFLKLIYVHTNSVLYFTFRL